MNRADKVLNWLQSSINKDSAELEREKKEFADSLRKMKKDDIISNESKKISIWKRIRKVLMGY